MANSNLMGKLQGNKDSRGLQGILSRGTNVYNGGSTAAHSGGGPQFGRPKKNPVPANRSSASPTGQAMQIAAQRKLEMMKRGRRG